MGFNFQSSDTQQTLNDFNKVVNDAVFNVVTEGSTNCSAVNELTIQTGFFPTSVSPDGTITYAQCVPPNIFNGININQSAVSRCNLTVQATNTLEQNVQTRLTQDIKQWISTSLTNNQGWLAIAASIAIANNTTLDNISNDIANSLSANITTKCNAYIQASNRAVFTLCGEIPGGINVNQNVLQTNLTNCLINNTVTAFQSNNIAQNIAQQTDTRLANSQEGLSTIAKWLIIGAIVLGAIIVIGLVLFFIFGNKSTPPMPPPMHRGMSFEERREVEECLIPARRRLEERGIPPTEEHLKPAVESCLIRKRAERREAIARVEEPRFEGERARENFEEPRIASETARERFENASRYGIPRESVSTLESV